MLSYPGAAPGLTGILPCRGRPNNVVQQLHGGHLPSFSAGASGRCGSATTVWTRLTSVSFWHNPDLPRHFRSDCSLVITGPSASRPTLHHYKPDTAIGLSPGPVVVSSLAGLDGHPTLLIPDEGEAQVSGNASLRDLAGPAQLRLIDSSEMPADLWGGDECP